MFKNGYLIFYSSFVKAAYYSTSPSYNSCNHFPFGGHKDCLQLHTLFAYKSFCTLNDLFRTESRNCFH